MTEISLRSLMIAIGSMAADRERLLQRIANEPSSTDEDERLSEQAMELDRALAELGDEYERRRPADGIYPAYDDLVSGAGGEARI